MKIQAVLFDLDGTLLNTLEDLTDSVNHVLAAHDMPLRSIEQVRTFVGNGIPMLIRRAVREGTGEEEVEQCIKEMLAYYADHCMVKTAAYPGAKALLQKLRAAGIHTAVITNKDQVAADELCAAEFDDGLSCVIGAAEGRRFKPAPDGVLAAMESLGALPSHTVYIGDSDVDMQTAKNAGLPAIGVLWGFRDRADLIPYQPMALASNFEELGKILLEAE